MQTSITPVTVTKFPGGSVPANTLYIRGDTAPDSSGRLNYHWELRDVQLVTPAVEAVEGTPAIPATDDTPEVPAVPAIPAAPAVYSTVIRDSGRSEMTLAQFNSWDVEADNTEYQLDCIAANLGLTRV